MARVHSGNPQAQAETSRENGTLYTLASGTVGIAKTFRTTVLKRLFCCVDAEQDRFDHRRHQPRYVVLSSEWDNVEVPSESARSSGVTVLNEYIRANYHAVAAFGPISVLERRAD
jgi:hypothetical protein